ncbi:MAG: fibronectin type III domain-containing protein, partial [archaeon]|nr:fibronectin type III domain-containing protein [archaeon]
NNPEADVVNYVINYGKSNSFGSAEIVATTSHEFIGLETGETYYFQIIAVDATGMQSFPSETASAQINNIIVSPNECDASLDQICDEDCGAGEDPDCELPDNNTNTDNNTVQGGFDFNFENLDLGQLLVSLILAAVAVVLAVKYKTILANKK